MTNVVCLPDCMYPTNVFPRDVMTLSHFNYSTKKRDCKKTRTIPIHFQGVQH